MNKNIIILYSDSVNSRLMYALAKEKNYNILNICFDYGCLDQSVSIDNIRKRLHISNNDLPPNFILKNIDWCQNGYEGSNIFPQLSIEKNISNHIFGRNLVFISLIACEYPLVDEIWIGSTGDDITYLSDSTNEFQKQIENILNLTLSGVRKNRAPIKVCFPLKFYTKIGIFIELYNRKIKPTLICKNIHQEDNDLCGVCEGCIQFLSSIYYPYNNIGDEEYYGIDKEKIFTLDKLNSLLNIIENDLIKLDNYKLMTVSKEGIINYLYLFEKKFGIDDNIYMRIEKTIGKINYYYQNFGKKHEND